MRSGKMRLSRRAISRYLPVRTSHLDVAPEIVPHHGDRTRGLDLEALKRGGIEARARLPRHRGALAGGELESRHKGSGIER